ncbi:hypothetical protein Tco_0413896 [Tanacetum coccineum]
MTVRAQPVMSPGHSARVTEAMALSDSAFRKRYRSSYKTPSPSLPLPVWKRYRDAERLGLTDKDRGLDNEGCSLDEEGLGLEGCEEEAVPEGQQQPTPVADAIMGQGSRSVPEPEGPKRVSALRQTTLTTWVDPEDGRTYIDVPVYPLPAPLVQTSASLEWSSGLLSVSPALSTVPSPIPSLMISLTIPLPIASPVVTPTATISVDEDQFLEVGAQLELYESILHDHTQRLDALPPTLFADINRDVRELYTRSGIVRNEILSQRYRFKSLEHE